MLLKMEKILKSFVKLMTSAYFKNDGLQDISDFYKNDSNEYWIVRIFSITLVNTITLLLIFLSVFIYKLTRAIRIYFKQKKHSP